MVPPRAPVVWYQYVESPSAAANGMFNGYFAMPLVLIVRRSWLYTSNVVGILVMSALPNIFLFTVVTMNEASYGMPTTWPSEVNDASCGMSALRPLVSSLLSSGWNQP